MSDISSNRPTLKIILVGDTPVGKTCLISSFFRQPFDFQSSPTVAPSYSCAEIPRTDGEIVCLQIWDTAGQERYHAVGKLFYRDSDVALVCYDPSSNQDLSNVTTWVESVRDEVPSVNIILVLTKADLLKEDQLKEYTIKGENLAKSLGAKHHFVTSSITNVGIKDVFMTCANIVDISNLIEPQPIPEANEQKSGCC
ncbi:small GTP-binding protein, putative [Trichomonas vaginalis G3]|uniref:Small GTP-binding protein, putative n=1 Tax=Trichomonas vaginalis (strain ATCC PRA-98 / G3) TaxID=412133 RepID=A2FH53_TRIV3|nr:small GTPase mediated signal transduction [Trichomonas vaginalis G3]EAX95778.1 small GTP-binding protein, putative [Trichomonas vaginalis G3]KAI5515003.1 small GTPase mediated signal transduction [Trichomonas vaginalis G3]|eukprot:XP_001308708.1 small GTP-binding protein [Trichomonas vaginalis G3]